MKLSILSSQKLPQKIIRLSKMESFKSLLFSWCNNIATNFDYNVVSLLMALFAGVMAMKIASRINDAHIRDEYEDDEKRPVIKADPHKAFCQTVRFTMRLRRKMRAFKEKKDKQLNK